MNKAKEIAYDIIKLFEEFLDEKISNKDKKVISKKIIEYYKGVKNEIKSK